MDVVSTKKEYDKIKEQCFEFQVVLPWKVDRLRTDCTFQPPTEYKGTRKTVVGLN